MKIVPIVIATLIITAGSAAAGDPPQTPAKTTVPGTGGYIWMSGPPAGPNNAPPNTGGSVGVQYPPDKGPTKTFCNGKPC